MPVTPIKPRGEESPVQTYDLMNESVNVRSAGTPQANAAYVSGQGPAPEIATVNKIKTPAPTPGTPAPTPVVAGDVIGSSASGVGPSATPAGLGLTIFTDPNQAAIDKAVTDSTSGYTGGVPDEGTIRQNTIAGFQTEIDAIDKAAAEARNRIATQYKDIGNRRVGSQRALLANSGQLGQVTGESQKAQLETANAQEMDAAIAAEQAKYDAQKQALLGQARTIALDTYQAKLKAYSDGAAATVQYLRDKQTNAQKNAAALARQAIAAGIDLTDKKNSADVDALAKQLGVSSQTLVEAYQSEVATKANTALEQAKLKAETLKAGQTTLNEGEVLVDADGKVLARGGDKPITLPEGSVILNADGTVKYKNPKTVDPLEQALKQAQIDKIRNDIAGGGDLNKILSANDAQLLGVPYGTTQGQALQMGIVPAKPATDGQNQAAGYATRVKQSGDILDGLAGDIANYNIAGFAAQQKLPNNYKTSQIQQYEQAARNFINAVLRRESGAAIAQSEFDNAYQQYLPYPGDSKEVLTQKKQNRNAVLGGLIQSSGPAYKDGKGGSKNDPLNILGDDPLGLGFNQAGSDAKNAQDFVGPILPTNIKLGSPLAIANNNPGNLRYAGQPGATQGKGGFARFESPQAGVTALQRQIELDASRGHTLASFINKYAPPSENNTGQYVEQAKKALGVSASTPIARIDKKALLKFMALKESSTKIG